MTRTRGDGKCRWCGHRRATHTGRPVARVLAKFRGYSVEWTTTACSAEDCKGCRRYEK